MTQTQFYEIVPASEVIHGAEGTMPVPVEQVRQRLRLPVTYSFATFHSDLEQSYAPEIWKACRAFLADFPNAVRFGKGLTLAGESGAGKTWAAAAVANEGIARYAPKRQFDVMWMPVAWVLPELFDYRTCGRYEEYYKLRKRILNCDLLIVDDLLHAGEFAMYKEFLFGVYDYRHQHALSIVTTMNAAIRPGDWSTVAGAFNGPFARRLQENSQGFTVSV